VGTALDLRNVKGQRHYNVLLARLVCRNMGKGMADPTAFARKVFNEHYLEAQLVAPGILAVTWCDPVSWKQLEIRYATITMHSITISGTERIIFRATGCMDGMCATLSPMTWRPTVNDTFEVFYDSNNIIQPTSPLDSCEKVQTRYVEREGVTLAVDQCSGRSTAQDVLSLPPFGAEWEEPTPYPKPLKERRHHNISGPRESVASIFREYQQRENALSKHRGPSKGIGSGEGGRGGGGGGGLPSLPELETLTKLLFWLCLLVALSSIHATAHSVYVVITVL